MADFIKLVEIVEAPVVVSAEVSKELDESSAEPEPEPVKRKAYKGPYPIKMLKKVRQDLTDCLILKKDQCESNYTDRIVETLKLKLKIKSKFNGDKRLLRRIERDTAQFKEDIAERISFLDRKLGKTHEVKRYFTACLDTAEPQKPKIEVPKPRPSATLSKFTFFNDSDEIERKSVETLPFFINKNKVNEVSKPLGDVQTPTPAPKRLAKEPVVDNHEKLDQLSEQYRKLRDKRNKGLRKKKGAEVDVQRRAIGEELKSIRIEMKKLRRQCNKDKLNKPVNGFNGKISKKKSKKAKNLNR